MASQLCISRLIEHGLTVFVPLDGSSFLVIGRPDGSTELVFASNASQDETGACIFRVPPKPILSVVCDLMTKTVWLLPPDIQEGRVSLRLGKKCDDYIIPEPLSLSFEDQKALKEQRLRELRAAAHETAIKSIEERKENES